MLSSLRRRFFQNAIDTRRPLRSLARWPRWLIACATRRPTIARFATGGLKMLLQPRLMRFGSTSIFIKRDHYEPELLAVGRLIRTGDVVLDIGGSFGIFALFMAHFTGPDGRVYSFEPGRFSFAQLKANCALNPQLGQIDIHNVAAATEVGEIELFHIGDSPVNFSTGGKQGSKSETVRAERVDAIVRKEDWARVAFVKIDVEGFEIAALEGARGILEAAKPAIMFEVAASALARQGQTPADIYAYLESYGYRFWRLERDAFVPVEGTPDGNIFAAMQRPGAPA